MRQSLRWRTMSRYWDLPEFHLAWYPAHSCWQPQSSIIWTKQKFQLPRRFQTTCTSTTWSQGSKDPFPVLIDESSWVGLKLQMISPKHPWKWLNKCRHYVSRLDHLEYEQWRNHHQWIRHFITSSHCKERSIVVKQQHIWSARVLLPSHAECKAVHPRTVETKARMGWNIQWITTERMVQGVWRPYPTIRSAYT